MFTVTQVAYLDLGMLSADNGLQNYPVAVVLDKAILLCLFIGRRLQEVAI